jgi:hypothetical protein
MIQLHASIKRGLPTPLRTSLAAFLLLAMLGASFVSHVPRVHAVLGTGDTVVEVGPNLIEQTVDTVADTSSSASEETLVEKEYVLDGIAFAVVQIALQTIAKATIRWIRSGFSGSPAFVTDLEGYLKNSADKIAGDFIYGSDLNVLCSPFQLDVRIALQLKYATRDAPARCTLSGVVNNVEGFLGGNFTDGGLPGWFSMTVNPSNNYFGASAIAESQLLDRIAQNKENNLKKLDWGKGFLSKEECKGTDDGKQKCSIVTPGDTISNALNDALHTGERSLLQADEINEVISALFGQLAVMAFEGARGVLGLDESGSGNGASPTPYLDQINNPKFDRFPGQNNLGDDLIARVIGQEKEYNALYADLVTRANAILKRIDELEALEANKDDEEEWVCANMDGLRAQAIMIRTPAAAKLAVSDKNLTTLNDLQSRFAVASQNAQYSVQANEERMRIMEEFGNLRTSGTLHTDVIVAREKFTVKPIQEQLSALAGQVEASCHKVEKSHDNNSNSDE